MNFPATNLTGINLDGCKPPAGRAPWKGRVSAEPDDVQDAQVSRRTGSAGATGEAGGNRISDMTAWMPDMMQLNGRSNP